MTDPLTALRDVPDARARLDAAELELIDQARRAGATWADVAGALGLASRQAAEQRRLRLATTVSRQRQQFVDIPQLSALRDAVAELERRVGADRRWDGRFPRAALVRMTLAAAVAAPPGGLFSLVSDASADLFRCEVIFPRPTQAAVDRLQAALAAATPAG